MKKGRPSRDGPKRGIVVNASRMRPGHAPRVTNLLTSHLTVPAPYFLRRHVRDIHRRLVIWISPVSAGGASARQGGARKEKAAHEGRPEFRMFCSTGPG